MPAPKKPFWLKPVEFIAPLLLVVAGAACMFLTFSAAAADIGKGNRIMIGIVGGVFFMFALAWVMARYIASRRWTYISRYGIGLMVDFGPYNVDMTLLAMRVYEACMNWDVAFGRDKVTDIAKKAIIWVEFRAAPVYTPDRRKVAGYWTPYTREVVVSVKSPTQDIDTTALAHEIGHMVQWEATGEIGESAHHKRANELGIR